MFSSLPLVVISCLRFVSVMLLCFDLVMSLRCLLFIICIFPFSSSSMHHQYSNFSVTVAFFQKWFLSYGFTVTWSPFLNSVKSWAFLSLCFFCCCFAFRILVFVSSSLNGDKNFLIVGNTLLNCLPKNLYAGDIPVAFDYGLWPDNVSYLFYS